MSDETGKVSGTDCPFGWFDGKSGHVCRQPGEHAEHKCRYCGAVHDPELQLGPRRPVVHVGPFLQ